MYTKKNIQQNTLIHRRQNVDLMLRIFWHIEIRRTENLLYLDFNLNLRNLNNYYDLS